MLLKGELVEAEEDGHQYCSGPGVWGVTKGKSLTTKQLRLGLAVHQAARSECLVNLILSAGHCKV